MASTLPAALYKPTPRSHTQRTPPSAHDTVFDVDAAALAHAAVDMAAHHRPVFRMRQLQEGDALLAAGPRAA
jgi:hypothetical protein